MKTKEQSVDEILDYVREKVEVRDLISINSFRTTD